MSHTARILLVHGAWLGSVEFATIIPLLTGRGWRVDTVELPSLGSRATLADDAAAITAALDAAPGPVVLVAHSYGGVPVTQAGDHPAVERLVYVASFALDVGESALNVQEGGPDPFLPIVDGQVLLGPNRDARIAMVAATLPPGTPAEVAGQIADTFQPHSLAALQGEVTQSAWRVKPTVYLLAEHDTVLSPALQERFAGRTGGEIVRLATGHSPFQEDPAGFVDLLERVATTPAVQSTEWSFPGAQGRSAARRWSGTAEPRYVALISHGYGEHTGRYDALAASLVDDGAVVYGIDHRGHGKSEGEPALITDFEGVVDDLHKVAETAVREHPGLPVVLIGHSLGGLVATRYAQRYGDTLAALVLSSPAIGAWTAPADLLALDPMPDVPLDSSTLSRDPRVAEAYLADELVWHGPFKRPTMQATQEALDAANDGPSFAGLPLLWQHGDDDGLIPLEASRVGIARLRGTRYEEHIYPGARHELFNEINADEVTARMIAFIHATVESRRTRP